MNIQSFLKIEPNQISTSDQKIIDYLNTHINHIPSLTIQKFAEDADTSVASVQRFCKKNGFSGYNEFKFDFRNFLSQKNSRTNKNNYFEKYAAIINKFAAFDTKDLDELIDTIKKSRSIFTFGLYYSSIPAKMLSLGLNDTSISNSYENNYVSEAHKLNLFTDQDTFIFFSFTANELKLFDHYFKDIITPEKNTYIITFNNQTKLKHYFKHVISLPGKEFTFNNFVDPQSLFCLVVEYIINKLAE